MVPFITVVMPVRNEARFIAETMTRLLLQEYPTDRYEIIVADGMSDDGTQTIVKDIAANNPQVILAENPKKLSSAGRNIGFKAGSGDYFLVIDGHCHIPSTQLLSNIASCFSESGADCLGRPQPLDPPGLTQFQNAVALARGSRIGHGGDSLIYAQYEGFASPVSNGAAYARHVFEKVGYVDEGFDAAEDVEFNYRVEKAGLTCFTSPRLTVRYYPRESLSQLFRQVTRYGSGRCRFLRKHPGAASVNQLVPVCFAAGLPALPVLALLSPEYPFPFLAVLALYLCYFLMLTVQSVLLAARHGISFLPYIAPILFTIHFGLGYGFIREATSGGSGENAAATVESAR